jgi:hypothetical protein
MNARGFGQLLSCVTGVAVAAWLTVACVSTPSTVPAVVTAGVEPTSAPKPAGSRQAASPGPETGQTGDRILEPYPYTSPVPPPTPTILDGVYLRAVEFEGTPTPCRRCAPYRAEGGSWTLRLDAGAYRVSHSDTGFQGIGSFSIADDKLVLFNDPNCHLLVGHYRWVLAGEALSLNVVEDECAFGLRARNLSAGSWIKQSDEEGQQMDRCQPPSLEAAISGHWPEPPECTASGVATAE